MTLERAIHAAAPRLRGYFASRVPPGDVDDLVQDTLATAVAAWPRFRGESAPATWIFGIGKNTLKAWYRGNREDSPMCTEPEVGDRFEDRIDAGDLLDRLPHRLRSLYYLRYEKDMKVEEIATFWQVPVGTVKYRLYELRAEVRRALS